MSKFDSPLNNIKIASPCPADWNEMYGDNRKRFCGECKLNVYNLSGMTPDEAQTLVTNAEGRLCVRYYQRADGTVITADCPVGWAKIKARTKIYATAVASMLVALFSGLLFVSMFSKNKSSTIGQLLIPFTTPIPQMTMGAVAISPPRPLMGNIVQGDISEPSTTPKRKTMTQVGAGDPIRKVSADTAAYRD